MKKKVLALLMLTYSILTIAQNNITFKGKLLNPEQQGVSKAFIQILNTNLSTLSNNDGDFSFENAPSGVFVVKITASGYATISQNINLSATSGSKVVFQLKKEGNELDEVIITAQKREENQQKTPLSISTLSDKQIKKYKIWDTKDITAIVPNLYASNPGDNRNITSIRGITSTSYDPAVATYIDGVNQFGLDTYISQLQDVERIEVLRGPQGTLYGRNAMGGVINIITKQPNNFTSGFAEIGLGNYNQQRLSAGVKFPLVKDKLFFGASGLVSKRDGYYTNTFNDSNFDKQESYMGNYYLKFLPNAKLAITLNAKHISNTNDGAFPLASSSSAALENPFQLNQNSIATMLDKTFNTSLSVNYNANHFDLVSQTAYQSNYRYYKSPIDGDFSPLDGYAIVNNYGRDWNNVKVLSQEIRLSSKANSTSKLKWLAGTYLFHQDNPVKQGTHIGDDGNLLGAPESNVTYINTNVGKGSGLAFFGQGTYAITEKLDMIFGLRYDLENRKLKAQGERQPDGDEVGTIFPETAASATFDAFSPKAGLNYKLNPNATLFATYNRGFRTGGISQLSGDPREALLTYEPEMSSNFEIGSKNRFLNNRLQLNLAAFYTLVNNAQVPTLLLPDAITVTQNVGELHSKGIEFQTEFIPFRNLEFSYNFGLTDAKYSELNLPDDGSTQTFKDNKQLFTPNVTSMLATQYNQDLTANSKTFARIEWRYLGQQYYDLANQVGQGSFHTLNLRAGFTYKKIELTLWAENITNKEYVDYAYSFGAAHLGTPRTYGVLLTTTF
ncbi:TonB-dependent receptor [Flavobacterium sp. UMI-01]|uniref:TonB-dependent receptor n=1 Tax=Flavobacterium sp. UMI-01 TaxID=1441053 RepID=UPI001C7E129F|nr:TonB-dependent receptor [Flavobacterium sp. UMI-01]GIZ09676.1 TonB-dependent receptor [Flavobacterium sp. UMI-01]